jgi:hypothetical protein
MAEAVDVACLLRVAMEIPERRAASGMKSVGVLKSADVAVAVA